jgi:ketosteroid isomerase-like protein
MVDGPALVASPSDEAFRAEVHQLSDRAAIRDCLSRYARGIDRADDELVASAYHEDAIDDHGQFIGSGRGLATWARTTAHTGLSRYQHHITNHYAELDGDVAHVETYFIMTARTDAGYGAVTSGRYIDRFEKRRGEWRIAQRICIVETTADLGDQNSVQVDPSWPIPRRDTSDLSYRRPLSVYRTDPTEPHQC